MKMPQLESLEGMRGAAGTEGARRATGVSADAPPAAGALGSVPDPEVSDKPKRRRFTAEYKRKILKQADACRPASALVRKDPLALVRTDPLSFWRWVAATGRRGSAQARIGCGKGV